jgi:serpin B
MKDGYAAQFDALDFRTDAERSRATINSWVEEQTRRKIRDLIPRGALNADTRLVLVNALYLKAPWESPFEASATRPAPFHFDEHRTKHVPTMRRTAFLGHATEPELTVVALDYAGRGLQFLIILPDRGTSPDAIAGKLTPVDFFRWSKLGDGRRPNVSLHLPKFRHEGSTVALGNALRALGMKGAFDEPPGSANFDRIAPRTPKDYLAMFSTRHLSRSMSRGPKRPPRPPSP